MFGHKEKAALAALPPQHHALAADRQLVVTQNPGQWAELFASLTTHEQTVHKHPLEPRVRGVLVPLIRALSEDVAPLGPIAIRADLRGHDAPGKVGPLHELPSRPPVTKLEEAISWDPWLVLEATLKDRSVLDLVVVDVTRIHKVRKRSASGKTKHKSKAKTTQRVTGKLTLPRGRGFAMPPESPVTGWLQRTAKPKGDRSVITAQGKIPLAAMPTPEWELKTLMLVIAELFRWVEPPAAATDPTASGAGGPA